MENYNYPLYSLPIIKDLYDLLLSKAETIPDYTAISYANGNNVVSKSFRTLLDDVEALVAFFAFNSICGEHIAIIGINSYQWLIVFLSIVCSRNVAVPIDRSLPSHEIKQLIEFSDCRYSFVSECCIKNCDCGNVLSTIETIDEMVAKGKVYLHSGAMLCHDIDADALAAIFFTSGTTGKSKGVMLSHKNMATDINSACKNFKLDGNSLSILPYHHTFGLITSVFMVLNYGKTVFINQNMRYIQKELLMSAPKLVFMVPLFVESFYKMIIHAEKSGVSAKKLLGGKLEYIICGGAPLNQKYIDFYKDYGIVILNGYGITECAPVVAVNRNHFQKDGSIGQILDCCKIRISEDGEILVSGDNVMLGYYKDEKSTSEAMKDSFFNTNDLGHYDADNFLYLTGRKKNLIILSNGENVSPEKLEDMVLANNMVREAVVYADNGIIAVEIYPAAHIDNAEAYFDKLIAGINSDLPTFMRINKVVLRTNEFEKNTNGKIIRNKVGGSKNA